MKVNNKLVEHLAHLSRLDFDDDSKEKMKFDFEKMLDFVAKLEEVDTDNVEPLSYMSSELNVLREDKVEQVLTQEQALKNAPVNDTDYIRIPKVIDSK
ncbi:MAG: aspartyl/glutamyl-tRNA(Asn/Gln) amidotransferase subunit C [Cryomorphaceae bacterium]|jgi:aspartyl-tRNA(Asn)/glutamyl-tRNA(Gln) amidotransferase subunit C|nr:MAG: aspartyl/glutamyl-tRNA(Asn/Gln) amidotransferase subunit C [Cryomorphaceae bacterium]|tara:strand:- start:3879 stop:4172 length:294 start_codon:yes stop_codon:yes gene_type:complete